MSRITRDVEEFMEPKRALWPGWLPLAILPPIPLVCGFNSPRWVLMCMLALLIYIGGKWLTWWDEGRWMESTSVRRWAYLLAWPGMNPREFLGRKETCPRPPPADWFWAGTKTALGAAMVWGLARMIPGNHELWIGWVGLVGIAFLFHFGVFHLIALAWQRAGVKALPIMCAPMLATSVAEFWNRRWNVAFNQLVYRYFFRPLTRRTNPTAACLAVFFISGVIHDLVISVPADGGYGLPTAYFMMQGCAVIFEHSRAARSLGLGRGCIGWLFTLLVAGGPAFWLFHPPFIRNVVLPMLKAVGATGKGI